MLAYMLAYMLGRPEADFGRSLADSLGGSCGAELPVIKKLYIFVRPLSWAEFILPSPAKAFSKLNYSEEEMEEMAEKIRGFSELSLDELRPTPLDSNLAQIFN